MTTTSTRSVANANDLTTVPDRNVQAVTDLLAGHYGTTLQALARDAVARAWMGGYLHDAAAVLLDVTHRAGRFGLPMTVGEAL